MTSRRQIDDFLAVRRLALVGLSRTGRKFGNAAYRELTAKGYEVFPVHPEAGSVGGVRCWPSLEALPPGVGGVVVAVPPEQTLEVVRHAAAAGIPKVWMQQGAESGAAVEAAEALGLDVVAGECVLMFAEPAGFVHRVHRWVRGVFGTLPAYPGDASGRA